ncbi:hypothetical protein BX600DRAFT_443982 [Xylariales sp. PMI_506]|nr:hypothetical protein BX600DRAFT_443982 [Xylariales sp. PMI_506]
MKPYRSSSAYKGQDPLERTHEKEQEQEIRSRFELLNLNQKRKSNRFSFSSFGPSSLRSPATVQSSWLRDPSPPPTPDPNDPRNIAFAPARVKERDTTNDGDSRICGVRRRWFWPLLALLVVTILAVAIGAGVGITQAKKSSTTQANSSSGSTSSSSSVTSISTSPTSTGTSTGTASSSSSTATSTGGVDCPAGNATTYTVPGSTKQFLHLCGINYNGTDEATDIGSVPTDSMASCMNNCAGTEGCMGCGWGYMEGDGLYQHTCWMKGNLTKSESADSSWAFAILL